MTHGALANELGITRVRVTQLAGRGMPTDTVEAARAWRAAHDRRGTTRLSRHAMAAAARAFAAPAQLPKESRAAPEDPEEGSRRMQDIERRAYAQIDAALNVAARTGKIEDCAGLLGLIRSYNQAAVNSLAASAIAEKHRRSNGTLAPVEHLANVLRSILEPLMAQLDSLPGHVAPNANPSEPQTAERAIADELNAMRSSIASMLLAG